jgi:hypothetical protein
MALTFHSANPDYIVPNQAIPQPQPPFSVSVWASLASNQFNTLVGDSSVNGWAFDLGSNGTVVFQLGASAGSSFAVGVTSPPANVWTHGGVSFDGTNWKIYYNGGVDASGANTVSFTQRNMIYAAAIGGIQTFAGSIADIAVWKVILSDAEFRALGKGVKRPGQIRYGSLVSWYPLDGYNHPALDLSSNKDFGIIHGSPTFTPGPPLISAAPIFPGISIPESFAFIPTPVFVLMPQIVT